MGFFSGRPSSPVLRSVASKDPSVEVIQAIRVGDVEYLQELIDAGKAPVNQPDKAGKLALCWAAQKGNMEAIQMLLKAGANANKLCKSGLTALHFASFKGHRDCAAALLMAGASIDREDEVGKTPLAWAAENGHVSCVKLFVQMMADVNRASQMGRTPLYWAVSNGHTECVQVLLNANADVHKVGDFDGQTPAFMAALEGHSECLAALIDAGACINRADKKGRTPLYVAIKNDHKTCVDLLRGQRATVDLPSSPSTSPKGSRRFSRTLSGTTNKKVQPAPRLQMDPYSETIANVVKELTAAYSYGQQESSRPSAWGDHLNLPTPPEIIPSAGPGGESLVVVAVPFSPI